MTIHPEKVKRAASVSLPPHADEPVTAAGKPTTCLRSTAPALLVNGEGVDAVTNTTSHERNKATTPAGLAPLSGDFVGVQAPLRRPERFRIEPLPLPKQDPRERVYNWDEVFLGFSPEAAVHEASRCLECEHAPCVRVCPLENRIPEAMFLIAEGRFAEAALKFLETSNMPDICGRICPQEKLCEGACVLATATEPVRIGKLEAFCVDYLRERYGYPVPVSSPPTGYQVAIVGAGPAGLVVAEELAKRGHRVSVFDAWPCPGGLLLYGIPNFKLKKEVPQALLERLERLGVRFVCGVRIGREHAVDELLREGYDAVFLGHGATAGNPMKTPGEELKNVCQATEYLVRANVPPEELPEPLRGKPHAGRRTAVIGGGDTAMDCVRTARRLNPLGEVYCVYRRTEAEMPGRAEERVHAREEGVHFEWLTLPKRFLGNAQGEVAAMECIRMRLGEPDAKGRRRPVEIPSTEFTMEVDTVVLALGYNVDPELAETTPALRVEKWGTIWVESEETGKTSRQEIWAAGDNVRGADLVVTAVAAARKAACDLDRTLRTRPPKKILSV